MGKLNLAPEVSNVTTWEELRRATSMAFKAIQSLLTGDIGFSDNFKCKLVEVTFSAANTDTNVIHDLAYVPSGYFLTKASAAMNIYTGTQSWTTSMISLKSSATGTATILVF